MTLGVAILVAVIRRFRGVIFASSVEEPTLTGWGPLGFRSSQLSTLLESLVFFFECHKCQQSPGCGPWGRAILVIIVAFGAWSFCRLSQVPRVVGMGPPGFAILVTVVFLGASHFWLGGERREDRREKRQEREETGERRGESPDSCRVWGVLSFATYLSRVCIQVCGPFQVWSSGFLRVLRSTM